MTDPALPRPIERLAADVASRGGRAYLVGGGVRDHLMGLEVKDWDIEVFGVQARDLVRLLRHGGHVNAVGRSFGVFKWSPPGTVGEAEIDVSIPRRDSKVGPGHKGIHVEGDPDMTVDEAARRRDLTINAMMWDIVDRRLVDPWGGRADLDAGLLRAVDDDTFLEDPLRALRVVQFAARLSFRVADDLYALCQRAALDELPAERIQGEWGKLLLKGTPSVGFAVARRARILERVFPEVAHVDADAVLDRLAAGPRAAMDPEGRAWALMLAGWLHTVPVEVATTTLDRLWMHSYKSYPVRDRTLQAIAAWKQPTDTDAALRHLSTRAELRLVLPLQAAVRDDDRTRALTRAASLGILERKPDPLIGGRELKSLGVPPGPAMGELLQRVYVAQLDGVVVTRDEALDLARALLQNAPPSGVSSGSPQ